MSTTSAAKTNFTGKFLEDPGRLLIWFVWFVSFIWFNQMNQRKPDRTYRPLTYGMRFRASPVEWAWHHIAEAGFRQ